MSKRVLERYWNGDPVLRNHPKVSRVFEEIRCDIRAGHVFPALRENEIHLYHEGGRVLRIRPQSVYTHRKYAHGCGDRNGEEWLCSLTNEKYQEIKKGCRCHNRKPDKETWIVSRLFKRFSVWADGTEGAQPKLIDIEVRLRPDQSEKASQMIDLLFLGDAGHLTFVEVKRQYDSRVRSQATPEVVGTNLRVRTHPVGQPGHRRLRLHRGQPNSRQRILFEGFRTTKAGVRPRTHPGVPQGRQGRPGHMAAAPLVALCRGRDRPW